MTRSRHRGHGDRPDDHCHSWAVACLRIGQQAKKILNLELLNEGSIILKIKKESLTIGDGRAVIRVVMLVYWMVPFRVKVIVVVRVIIATMVIWVIWVIWVKWVIMIIVVIVVIVIIVVVVEMTLVALVSMAVLVVIVSG